MPPQPLDASPQQILDAERKSQQRDDGDKPAKPLPKGVVLGPDGKPCRTCTDVRAWSALTKAQSSQGKTSSSTQPLLNREATPKPPQDCPADVEQLGRSTWTLLHTLAANYPEQPSAARQADTKQFMGLFGRIYPCWVCADDFRAWMESGNEPRVSNRNDFGKWLCEAHNAVNVKLGKKSFDCDKWEERWRTGWKDGRCD